MQKNAVGHFPQHKVAKTQCIRRTGRGVNGGSRREEIALGSTQKALSEIRSHLLIFRVY